MWVRDMDQIDFNRKDLLRLGILEETVDLYYNLIDVFRCAYDSALDIYGEKNLFGDKIKALAVKRCRQLLDAFLKSYTYIFTEKFEILRTNASCMKCFSMLNTQIKKFSVIYRLITFDEFLGELTQLVFRIVDNRIRHENPQIPAEAVIEHIQRAINDNIVNADKVRTCRTPQSVTSDETPLVVFRNLSSIYCRAEKHVIVPMLQRVEFLEKDGAMMIPVHHCLSCGKAFVGHETIKVFEQSWGKFKIKIDAQHSYREKGDFPELHKESKLHCEGYNVIAGKLSEKERQDLLVRVLEEGELTYTDICTTIENNIRTFSNSYYHRQAVEKWKLDLSFFQNYVKGKIENK